MTMNQPMGRVVALDMRNVAQQPGAHPTVPVLRVYIRMHTGDMVHHDLLNSNYTVQNAALQFMALYGYRPSTIEGYTETYVNVEDDMLVLPIAPMPAQESWGLAQDAMSGGEKALREVEWFSGADIKDGEKPDSPPAGGGSDGDGGGHIGVEKTDEDSDAGINVEVK